MRRPSGRRHNERTKVGTRCPRRGVHPGVREDDPGFRQGTTESEGRMGDAWALGGEEGRDKLRKAAGRGKCPLIRGFPNGATRRERSRHPRVARRRTRGTETSKYPQEKKVTTIPRVEAIERGTAQTGGVMRRVPGL